MHMQRSDTFSQPHIHTRVPTTRTRGLSQWQTRVVVSIMPAVSTVRRSLLHAVRSLRQTHVLTLPPTPLSYMVKQYMALTPQPHSFTHATRSLSSSPRMHASHPARPNSAANLSSGGVTSRSAPTVPGHPPHDTSSTATSVTSQTTAAGGTQCHHTPPTPFDPTDRLVLSDVPLPEILRGAMIYTACAFQPLIQAIVTTLRCVCVHMSAFRFIWTLYMLEYSTWRHCTTVLVIHI